MKEYKVGLDIGFTEVDTYYDLRPRRLLDLLGEVSMRHTLLGLGLDADYMEQTGNLWVLYSWKVHLENTKLYTKKVVFKTFATVEKNMYCYRYYILEDEKNNVIGYALAHWIAININMRKFTKIPESIVDIIATTSQDLNEEQIRAVEKLSKTPSKKIRNIEFDHEEKFPVRFYDLDGNKHVNNTIYLDWALETIYRKDKNFIHENVIEDISVCYKKEKAEGENVISKVKIDGKNTYHEILDEEGNLLTILELKFKERKYKDIIKLK